MDRTPSAEQLQGTLVARPYPAADATDRIFVRRGYLSGFLRRTQGTLFFCVSSGLALVFVTMVLKIIFHT
jgi:hypothetical protein